MIKPPTVSAAIKIARYAIPHARTVFDAMGANELLEGAEHILRWIRRYSHASFDKRQLFQNTKNRFRRVEDLDGPLALLVEHHIIRERPQNCSPLHQQNHARRGRPRSPHFEVNPEFTSATS